MYQRQVKGLFKKKEKRVGIDKRLKQRTWQRYVIDTESSPVKSDTVTLEKRWSKMAKEVSMERKRCVSLQR